MPTWHLPYAEAGSARLTYQQSGMKRKRAGNTGNIMLGAEQSSSLHPILVSEAEAESRSSFQQEPPRWVRHRLQSIQMCSVAHKAFLCRSGVRTSLTFWLQCEFFFFFFKGERQQRFSLIGGSTPQGVKWVQTWNMLTRELCWLLMRCIAYRSQIIFYYRPHEDKLRMNSKSKEGKHTFGIQF